MSYTCPMRSCLLASVLVLALGAQAAAAEPTTVIAKLESGPRHIIACGYMAFIGVYVYEIETSESGPPLAGRVVVDILCPDFLSGTVKLGPGERHRLVLGPARKDYAGATAPASPAPALPRFEALKVLPVGK